VPVTEAASDNEGELLRLLADSIDEVFWLASADISQTLYVSPAFEKIWGLTREALYARPMAFLDVVHPDDRARVRQCLTVQRAGQPFEHEYRLRFPDGSVRWIRDRGFPVREADGSLRYYAGVAKEITQRKLTELQLQASEQRQRTLNENAPIGLAIVGLDGRFHSVNPALCAITGYAESELLGMSFQDITHPDDLVADMAQFDDMLAGRMASFKMEKRYIRKTGEIVWVQLTAAVARTPEGEPDYTIGQIEDISERKKTQEALRKSQSQLKRLSERRQQALEDERKRIAREVHDELGQVLTAIKMGISLLKLKHAGDAALEGHFTRLLGLAEQGFGVVRNITSSLRPATLDLGLTPALQWLVEQFEVNTGLPCELSVSGLDRAIDDAHATAIFRMVQESLTNVARHAKASRVVVSVDADDREAAISVSDNGCGFDSWMATSSIQGVGLAGIVERIESLGGLANIVSNTDGEGTSIRATLPLSPAGNGS
jgi:two-component system, NarL family, sensor histidine kinase UhpB